MSLFTDIFQEIQADKRNSGPTLKPNETGTQPQPLKQTQERPQRGTQSPKKEIKVSLLNIY